LFSREALAPIAVEIATAHSVRAMVFQQTIALPSRLTRDRSAILICPGFPPSLPASLFGARCLPYIHDLFLITRPGDLNPRAKLYMAPAFRAAVRRLPRFMVNSQTTREELKNFCRPDAEIQLYRPAVRNVFGVEAQANAARASDEPTINLIALGTIEPRKNLLAAAAIVTALRARGFADARLDIVGRQGWGEDATKLAQIPGVVLHGYQPIERVRALLGAADALISTSHDEGLGLPLLEAQYAGLQIIAPDQPVFREVLGDSGLFINPSDASDAADRIASWARSPGSRAGARAAALNNLDRWMALANADHIQVLRMLGRLCGIGNAPC